MTWAGRSRSLARPVSARTRRTTPGGNVLAITPRLMWSLTRMPAGRPAGARGLVAARPRTSPRMAQLCPYVNRIGVSARRAHEVAAERAAAGLLHGADHLVDHLARRQLPSQHIDRRAQARPGPGQVALDLLEPRPSGA